MKVHEYQAELLARYGVPIPCGRVAETAAEAAAIAKELGVPVAVKAQIHAGGRGIKLGESPEQAREGRLVKRVLVKEQLQVERE